ncbi:hypothetical protein OROHE_012629 [Orobanche hederae]
MAVCDVCPPTMSLLFVIMMGVLCVSDAYTFYVGGDDGWKLHPSENYSHWAKRIHFEINDELVFKYKKGHDSVLVVDQNDYTKCNKDNPIKALKSGHSKFKFDRSGPFFFISGHEQNCEKGQKLKIIVPHHHHHNIAPSHPPETPLKPPSPAPTPSRKAPTPTPIIHHSPSPSPTAKAPAQSTVAKTPAQAPSIKPPSYSPSPSPTAKPPTHVPLIEPPSQSPSPTTGAVHAPPVEPPSHSPSPSPVAKTPSNPTEPRSRTPTPSPAAKAPAHAPSVKTPTYSPSQSPAAKTPMHLPPIKPPSHSPSPSPMAKTPSNPTEPRSRTPTPSPAAKAPAINYGGPQPHMQHRHHATLAHAHLRMHKVSMLH